MNIAGKCCKKLLIPWKSTINHRFGQNYATSRNKLPCFGVSMNFWARGCKKWLISWKRTKNHRFGQNFATFGTSYHVFAFRWTFQQKVPHFVKKHEKSSIWLKLATFRTNYHVLAFRWTLQQKVAKSCSCRGKARKIIEFSKTWKFFEQTTMSWRFEDFFSKKVEKVAHFIKNDEKSSIWPKLATFLGN